MYGGYTENYKKKMCIQILLLKWLLEFQVKKKSGSISRVLEYCTYKTVQTSHPHLKNIE